MSNRLYGDWERLERILHRLKDNKMDYDRIIILIGEAISARIKQLIASQSIHLEPLVEDYRESKKADGYGNDILIRTGDFIKSIQVVDIKTMGDSVTVFIGIRGGRTKTGISMDELAQFLEYGTENMIARYPIRKSWEMIRKDIRNEVSSRILSEIRRDMR